MALRLLRQEEAEVWAAKAEKFLPRTRAIHGFLSIGLKKNIINLEEIKFYVPKDETLPFFIFINGVSKSKEMQNCTLFWDHEKFKKAVLINLLESVPGWDWNYNNFFYLCYLPLLEQLEDFILCPNGLGEMKLKQESRSNDGYVYIINAIDKAKYNYPVDEYVLDYVLERDAEHLFDNWIYKDTYSVSFIEEILEVLPAIGAYVKQPDGDHLREKPVSWAVSRHNGEIGMTTTLPEHRGKGLAGAVTLKLSEILLERGINPIVVITGHRPWVVKLHEKLGFVKEELCPVGYHIYSVISDQ